MIDVTTHRNTQLAQYLYVFLLKIVTSVYLYKLTSYAISHSVILLALNTFIHNNSH
jgi:hypothetical protein